MPDVTAVLEKDHRKVEQLFERYEKAKSSKVVEQICLQLTVHAMIEEEVVYPVLASDVPKGGPMRKEGEKEHRQVKQLIARIQKAGYDSPKVEALIQKAKEDVAHHVEEEENDVFPAMREALGSKRLNALGRELTAAMKRAMADAGSAAAADAGAAPAARSAVPGARAAGSLEDKTRQELYSMAQDRGVPGRSRMSKDDLVKALQKA